MKANVAWTFEKSREVRDGLYPRGDRLFQLKVIDGAWETITIDHRGEQKAYGRDRGNESLDTPWTSHLQTS